MIFSHKFVRKLNIGDGRARYESKIGSLHHDHLICEMCGKIIEFVDSDIEKRQVIIANKHQFSLQRHVHQLFGNCKECQ